MKKPGGRWARPLFPQLASRPGGASTTDDLRLQLNTSTPLQQVGPTRPLTPPAQGVGKRSEESAMVMMLCTAMICLALALAPTLQARNRFSGDFSLAALFRELVRCRISYEPASTFKPNQYLAIALQEKAVNAQLTR